MRLTLGHRKARIMAALTSAFLAIDSACAHGGISALGGLRDGLLGPTGIAGLPVLGVMLWILLRRRRQDKADIRAGVGISITMAYVVIALFFYFAAPCRRRR